MLRLPHRLLAQDRDPVSFYRQDPLEAYLERADWQSDETVWRQLADRGSDAALAAWESQVLLLCEDAAALADAREVVRDSISGEVEDRFTEWLVKRFFRKLPAVSLASFHGAVRAGNLAYLFVTEDGQISWETATGDPRLKDAEGLTEDRAAWRAGVQAGIEQTLAAWQQSVEASTPELLAVVPEAGRETVEELLARSQAGFAQGLRRELDALFMQEEAGFVARRLSDSYSLRRKSEQATAGAVASRLIAETKLETDKAIRALEEGLRGAPDDPAGQARIDPSRWQQSFAVALEAGLAKWDAAEERLLVERVEWELQAGRDYGDGAEAWAAAWKQMEAQRSRWETEIRAVLAEGEAAWREEQAGLVAAIHSAAEEFERSARQAWLHPGRRRSKG